MITKVAIEQFEEVKKITQDTIAGIYPKYYPTGAVDFFKKHHNDEYVGTVTVKENEICRLSVYQKSGVMEG